MARMFAVAAALAGLAALSFSTPAAAQRGGPASLLLVDGSGGLSLRETPLTFNAAEVLPVSLRVGVPLRFGIEPWVSGALAHIRKLPCDSAGPGCSNTERRVMAGAMYMAGGRGEGADRTGGPYVGVGLGVRQFRGQSDFAHSVVLGLPLGGESSLAPAIELRSESYRGFSNELLIVAVGFRFGLGTQ